MIGMLHDGDAFTRCELGHRHWGRFGAAGLLLHHDGAVLLQHRSEVSIGGGTWSLFGGAKDSGENSVAAALREAAEESTLDTSMLRVRGLLREDHGGWHYDTVVADAAARPDVGPASWETKGARWVAVADVEEMDLFEPFRRSWTKVRDAMTKTALIIDTANVMGSRNDGWWRDRKGAAERLRDQVDTLTELPLAPFDTAFPELVMIVEGKARGIAGGDRVTVLDSPGDGDDTIAATAAEYVDNGYDTYVVTADRELRRRTVAAGATALGPRWLLDRL